MSEQKHTAEPWTMDGTSWLPPGVIQAGDFIDGIHGICEVHNRRFTDETNEANAIRIIVCVNACAGISTVALHEGAIKELTEACRQMAIVLRTYKTTPNGRSLAHRDEPGGASYVLATDAIAKLGDIQ